MPESLAGGPEILRAAGRGVVPLGEVEAPLATVLPELRADAALFRLARRPLRRGGGCRVRERSRARGAPPRQFFPGAGQVVLAGGWRFQLRQPVAFRPVALPGRAQARLPRRDIVDCGRPLRTSRALVRCGRRDVTLRAGDPIQQLGDFLGAGGTGEGFLHLPQRGGPLVRPPPGLVERRLRPFPFREAGLDAPHGFAGPALCFGAPRARVVAVIQGNAMGAAEVAQLHLLPLPLRPPCFGTGQRRRGLALQLSGSCGGPRREFRPGGGQVVAVRRRRLHRGDRVADFPVRIPGRAEARLQRGQLRVRHLPLPPGGLHPGFGGSQPPLDGLYLRDPGRALLEARTRAEAFAQHGHLVLPAPHRDRRLVAATLPLTPLLPGHAVGAPGGRDRILGGLQTRRRVALPQLRHLLQADGARLALLEVAREVGGTVFAA